YLVKSYKDNLMYIGDNFNFFQKMYYYKDSLYQMKWKITKNTKNILGKKCSEAKLSFRGRNYTAYYSQDFGVSEGPWKFFGLPGLILEVKSDDGEYTWIAIEIKKNPKEKLKNISYTNAKYTSRQEFIKDYISNFNKMIAKQKATGRNGFLKIQNEEIFYPEAQKEFGIGY
ncbi:MAG: GLPGLI family protein, partial [Thermonemataceae bacterium]|nr:GLPGLI family protein [Thermonemataceae bacterium]